MQQSVANVFMELSFGSHYQIVCNGYLICYPGYSMVMLVILWLPILLGIDFCSDVYNDTVLLGVMLTVTQ